MCIVLRSDVGTLAFLVCQANGMSCLLVGYSLVVVLVLPAGLVRQAHRMSCLLAGYSLVVMLLGFVESVVVGCFQMTFRQRLETVALFLWLGSLAMMTAAGLQVFVLVIAVSAQLVEVVTIKVEHLSLEMILKLDHLA